MCNILATYSAIAMMFNNKKAAHRAAFFINFAKRLLTYNL
ncbi:hypothetical protein APA_3171 [Pseudanabaena sp. lw0831]|nr:hypothetical protein APA_3171 [Pseudanabaena sp. lw0831]